MRCPLCGETGSAFRTNLHDRTTDDPRSWAIFRCNAAACGAGWLDPWPDPSEIASLYPGNYPTHTESEFPEARPRWIPPFVFRYIADGYLAEYYPVEINADAVGLVQRLAGRLLHFLPVRRAQVDFSVMYLRVPRNGRLLDLGCGNGSTMARMKRRGWRVDGIEPDERAAAVARRNGFSVRTGEMTAGDAGADYDAILLCHVIEHIMDPETILRYAATALKPGGALVVLTPNFQSIGHRYWGADWMPLEPPRHLVLFTPPALFDIVASCGLTVESLTTNIRDADSFFLTSREIRRRGQYRPMGSFPAPSKFFGHIFRFVAWLWILVRPLAGEEIVVIARKPRG